MPSLDVGSPLRDQKIMPEQEKITPRDQRIIAALEDRLLKSQKGNLSDLVPKIIGMLIALFIAAKFIF